MRKFPKTPPKTVSLSVKIWAGKFSTLTCKFSKMKLLLGIAYIDRTTLDLKTFDDIKTCSNVIVVTYYGSIPTVTLDNDITYFTTRVRDTSDTSATRTTRL